MWLLNNVSSSIGLSNVAKLCKAIAKFAKFEYSQRINRPLSVWSKHLHGCIISGLKVKKSKGDGPHHMEKYFSYLLFWAAVLRSGWYIFAITLNEY